MKILYLEDEQADAELVDFTLRSEWPSAQLTVVSTEEEFAREVNESAPDLILSDFTLVRFDGLEALKLSRERRPFIPFIFFSGTIGEDRAVEAMRNGATDYVIKDRPQRLVAAIKRALDAAQESKHRRAVEDQLLRAQRLENIGLLAGSIAHDFNNALSPIMMAIPLLREDNPSPLHVKVIDTIERSVTRGAELAKQILAFTHGTGGEMDIVEPKYLLRETISLIRQTFPPTIRVNAAEDPKLWRVIANPLQLRQALLNLCINAREAMPNGGQLIIRARNEIAEGPAIGTHEKLAGGSYMVFEVSDTGIGIPSEIIEKIWEPFFTTKRAGKGPGLGLSTVRTVAGKHHGSAAVESQPGLGSTFRLSIPAAPPKDTE